MDNEQYLKAKLRYHNAHSHLESLQGKQRKSLKRIGHLNVELRQQESKLQTINEKLAAAVEMLRLAKEIYGPLHQEWKSVNQKGETR